MRWKPRGSAVALDTLETIKPQDSAWVKQCQKANAVTKDKDGRIQVPHQTRRFPLGRGGSTTLRRRCAPTA